jgi:uncharacterized protein (UPF0276 family)
MQDSFGLLYDNAYAGDFRAGDTVDFVEIIPDRFFGLDTDSGIPGLPESIPKVFHSLDFSLGSDEALDGDYLQTISNMARQLKPMWASDHLAFTQLDGMRLGHLSPIRLTNAAAGRIAAKIAAIQNELQIPFLVENIAYYYRIPGADVTEIELLERLVKKTGCGLLLDINNVAVNAANHGFDPYDYLRGFPLHAVREVHIAGHVKRADMLIDSHSAPVSGLVWDLLRFVSRKVRVLNIVLERDQELPPFRELVRELGLAKMCVAEARQAEQVGGSG